MLDGGGFGTKQPRKVYLQKISTNGCYVNVFNSFIADSHFFRIQMDGYQLKTEFSNTSKFILGIIINYDQIISPSIPRPVTDHSYIYLSVLCTSVVHTIDKGNTCGYMFIFYGTYHQKWVQIRTFMQHVQQTIQSDERLIFRWVDWENVVPECQRLQVSKEFKDF